MTFAFKDNFSYDNGETAGDIEHEGIYIMNRGNIYVKLNRIDEALKNYDQAEVLLKKVFWPGHSLWALLANHQQ